MLFNSYAFIFLFLPITLMGYFFISHKRIQLPFLFLASVFFYAYWSTTYVFLLLFTVILDFYVARAIFNSEKQSHRKLLLVLSIVTNLSILIFFKYYNFFVENLNGLLSLSNSSPIFQPLQLILPIGISFYTFQSMSYVIDVYRKTSTAHAGLLEFASYVTLFPHQISGPLVRHNTIVPQLENANTYFFNSDNFWRGCSFFIFGIAKKILIADRLAVAVDPLVHNIDFISNSEAWLAMLGYTFQLYFDFSGYSDMAVGLGLMMNIHFPQNFNSPYKSKSVTEFWQKWHMTLSSWLKDYLYISLGGNRSTPLKTYRNLILTMTIGGLWHGANWTYVVWGLLHGMALATERLFKNRGLTWSHRPGLARLSWALTFLFANLTWIFFRAPNLNSAQIWLSKIFLINENLTWNLFYIATKHKDRFLTALVLSLILAFWAKNTWEIRFKPSLLNAILLAFLFSLSLTYMGDESPFLYFQF